MTFKKINENEQNNIHDRSCIILVNFNNKEVAAIKTVSSFAGIKDRIVLTSKNGVDIFFDKLNEMGYETVNAQGAFYVFPKIENPEEFVKKSAEEGVITVPGAAFGQNGENHVRMSYANSYENIAKAMDILEKGE